MRPEIGVCKVYRRLESGHLHIPLVIPAIIPLLSPAVSSLFIQIMGGKSHFTVSPSIPRPQPHTPRLTTKDAVRFLYKSGALAIISF